MSRVYFHSPSGTAEVRGSERAHAAQLINNLLWTALQLDGFSVPHPFRVFLPPDAYLHGITDDRFTDSLKTWLAHSHDSRICFPPDSPIAAGESVSTFTVALNTALVIGSDPIKFLARLHGQCEVHSWVDGPNRPWLADIIESGSKTRILREYGGWQSVLKLLRSRADEPVVMSYSVCESFPNRQLANWGDDPDGERWNQLATDERWRLALAGLRAQDGWLEMTPDRWDYPDYHFGTGTTGFDVYSAMTTVRAKKAVTA